MRNLKNSEWEHGDKVGTKQGRTMEFKHYSVLLRESLDNLNIRPDGIYLDGTLGGAGHSFHIAERLTQGGHLYGTDQDENAIEAATKRLEPFKDRVTIIRDNYENAVNRLKGLGVTGVDGILLDLGVSSYQLDNAERGFTYKEDVPLDMRMDQRQALTARDIVNNYSETEIFHIIRDFGEDKFAKNIAKHICMARSTAPIETTGQLNDIIKAAIPARMREKGGHPSKRTYQAIRIALNRELDVLQNSLDGFIDFLNPGGRLCVITFHSLEDRITKNIFKTAENPCICPPQFPVCTCGKKPKGRAVTRKPIIPGEKELEENKRSQSAKLRVFEKS
jgi:16S rRNA (cytosine1402-N4)-methyltransferase